MKLLRIFTWMLRVFLFLVLLLFALKNTDSVRLRFLFDVVWETPLAFLLLVTLVVGAVLGLVAGIPRLFAQRREIARLRKELAVRDGRQAAVPPVDAAG